MKEQRTLCSRCLQDYIQAGFRAVLDRSCKYKEPCEKCECCGYTYLLTDPREERRNANKTMR